MSRVLIKPVTATEALYVAENLRDEDRVELETASGLSAPEAVFKAWAWSVVCWVATVDGEPAIIFGVAPEGVVWMVCTPAITRTPMEVFKTSKVIIEKLLALYPTLQCAADCRNEMHLRWLRRLGFKQGGFRYLNGYRFRNFHIRKEDSPCASPQQSSQASAPPSKSGGR